MSTEPDPLLAVILAVPRRCMACGAIKSDDLTEPEEDALTCRGPAERDPQDIAKAVRKWITEQLPAIKKLDDRGFGVQYAAQFIVSSCNALLYDVRKALGLHR